MRVRGKPGARTLLERLNKILLAPTPEEKDVLLRAPLDYQCRECETSELPKPCRTKGCVCCPKCGAV